MWDLDTICKFNWTWEQHVLNEAESWLGTPYAARQCLKGQGADCGSFLHHCYSLVLPLKTMPKDYAVDWSLHSTDELYMDFIKPYVEEVDRPIYGGLGTWLFGRAYAHGGLIDRDGSILHAYGRTGAGTVRRSRVSFFRLGGKPRPVKWWYPTAETIEMMNG